MCSGIALTMYRFTAFRHRTLEGITCPASRSRIVSLVAGIFFAAVLAAQAQESVEPDVLPSLAEPPAASAEAPPSVSTEPLPALPQSLPSTAAEAVPSAPEPLPSSEQAFPSSPEPLSPSMNYTTAQTTVVQRPVAAGPYGGTYDVFPAGEGIAPSGRIFHYALGLTVRGVWDDNIFITHTEKVSDYYFVFQ